MAISQDYVDFITDQLSVIDNVESKKMFGGVGFFKDGIMFAMIGKGKFRLRVDDQSKEKYINTGMDNLKGKKGGKGMPYYEVPEEIVNDRSELKTWAMEAYEIAESSKK